ncbi:MAG: hypothetical protein U5K29_01295 [Acidimicrobiales bacterium]|nr:hypothetical protein [Acidimicrobiales bacterium]
METRRWTNPHQPQTLQIAVLLLYIRAVLGLLLGGTVYQFYWGFEVNLLASIAMVAGGLGIANEKRWGYRLAVGITVLGLFPLVAWLWDFGPSILGEFRFVTIALFPIAQVVLLLHPLSRQHQRIWFT